MVKLASRDCTTLKKGTTAISESVTKSLSSQLNSAWQLKNNTLERKFKFKDFYQTIAFVNAIAWVANQQNHHPDLKVSYNKCIVSYTSHTAKGLTVNDFICAAKIDTLISSKAAPSSSAAKKAYSKVSTKKPESRKDPDPALEFNVEEAESLLTQPIKNKTPEPSYDDDEDEFMLLEPLELDHDLTQKNDDAAEQALNKQDNTADKTLKQQKNNSNQPKSESAADKTVKQQKESPKKPKAKIQKDDAENTKAAESNEDDFMATMIIPPGMISTKPEPNKANSHAADDPTIVMHAVKINDDDDMGDTLITTPEEELAVAKTQVIDPALLNQTHDPDEVRTVILATTDDISKPPATNNKNNVTNKRPTKPTQQAPSHSNKEEDIEKTMVLSSNPKNNLKPNTATTAKPKGQTP